MSLVPLARRLVLTVGRRNVAPSLVRVLSTKVTPDNPSKSPYDHGAHRSNAEKLVAEYPVTEVAGTVALCDGGGGALGHPIEYIQLNNVHEEVATCGYCGLRYKMKHGHHGGH